MQKTKIVATIGPATESDQIIENLILEGVNLFRFNMKHNTHDWHKTHLKKVQSIAHKLNKNVATFADLQGPELRTGAFPEGIDILPLNINQPIIFGNYSKSGITQIPFDDLELVKGIEKEHIIYIDDGKVVLHVDSTHKDYLMCHVVQGRGVGQKKSVSIPNTKINVPTLLKKDKIDVKFAVANGFDYVALSFVRDDKDITTLRKMITRLKGKQKIIAKIETRSSIDNIHDIIDKSDGIMIARGDLGVEIPVERVPKIQEQIIDLCRMKYTPVIVATQMLLSMVNSPIPSRAEVSDIANSVMDKTDALMMSEETATGSFPVEAVRSMAKIARYNESNGYHETLEFSSNTYQEMILRSAVEFSNEKHIKGESLVRGYIVFTESGKSARILSRFRTSLPIFAVSPHENVVKELAISYGVYPFLIKLNKNPIINTRHAIGMLKKGRLVDKGEKIIVIFGSNVGEPEGNNTLSIIDI